MFFGGSLLLIQIHVHIQLVLKRCSLQVFSASKYSTPSTDFGLELAASALHKIPAVDIALDNVLHRILNGRHAQTAWERPHVSLMDISIASARLFQ